MKEDFINIKRKSYPKRDNERENEKGQESGVLNG